MTNSNNSVVYQIRDEQENCLYIGSTKNYHNRMIRHRHNADNLEVNIGSKKIYQKIRELGGFENISCQVIQTFNNVNKQQLLEKEKEYINLLKPSCNMRRPCRTQEEINIDRKKWKKRNYEKRGHIYNAKKREIIKCNVCNVEITRGCYSRHTRTKKHLDKVEIKV